MAGKKQGLGKGLGSLLGDMAGVSVLPEIKEITKEEAKTAQMIPIRDIEPNRHQPRKHFSEEELNELADSIRTYGVITPVIVVKEGNHYMIIAGERRWRAAKIAGVRELPAVVREYTEQEIAEISLVENIQRSDLNPIEEAMAYDKLMKDYDLTQEVLSERLAKSRSSIANALRLLRLPEDVQNLLAEDKISTGHAKAILSLDDPVRMSTAARVVAESGISVRETELLVKNMMTPQKPRKPKKALKNEEAYKEAAQALTEKLDTKVSIIRKAENAGKIEIEFYNLEDIERILKHIV